MKSTFRYILLLLAATWLVASCTDEDLVGSGAAPMPDDEGIGQLVLFSSGNADNTASRAPITRYMEQDGRFVCKMYYHSKATDTDASDFDVENTPITSWLRVDDNEGNSVYWQNDFDMTGVDTNHQDYLDYGFDSRAQYFYWRNRLDHIFLGFTDYNLLKTNKYLLSGQTDSNGQPLPAPRSLFMYPDADGAKKTKVDEIESWETVSYRRLNFGFVTKPNPAFSLADKQTWEAEHPGETYPVDETIEVVALTSTASSNQMPSYYGAMAPLSSEGNFVNITQQQLQSTRTKILELVDQAGYLSFEDKEDLKNDLLRTKNTDYESNSEGTFRYERWYLSFDPDADGAYNTDGSINLTLPSVTVYCRRTKQKIEDVIAVAPANTFDLTRAASMTQMSDQPDPLIAHTKMKPTGATQEANRVRLYFKHQFSQIQVNLTNAENTAEIVPENIVSVELLGVSEKGYVFTNINPDGSQIRSTYEPVVISKYTEDQLKQNPFGTAFNMFVMDESDKPTTSLKSFNAIAFGQLQAIRITWKEENYYNEETGQTEEGVRHVATYKITVDDRGNSLVNLSSGYRYMYDFELRRGTIAFIRATIEDWLLDDELNYSTNGIIRE